MSIPDPKAPISRREYQIVHRSPDFPLALLIVSKNIRQEVLPIATTCPIHLEVEGCRGFCLLTTLLPEAARRRIQWLVTDECFWTQNCDWDTTLPWDLSPLSYPSLRHLELQGQPKVIPASAEIVDEIFTDVSCRGLHDYKLNPDFCIQAVESWASWTLTLKLSSNAVNSASNCAVKLSIPGYNVKTVQQWWRLQSKG